MNTRFTLDHESLRRERRGKTGDRSSLTVQVLAGPNGWHDQRRGLQGLAIEVVAHRLRLEALPLRDKLSGDSIAKSLPNQDQLNIHDIGQSRAGHK